MTIIADQAAFTPEAEIIGPFAKAIAKEISKRIDGIYVAEALRICHALEITVAEFWALLEGKVDITANQIEWIADHLRVTPQELVAAAEMNA
ncbi:hypothetical protein [Microbacterium sp.]|uniref:hypothetical protein n=1 Tax=Microbacterium sp. TaxID=51671 RepID=UPI003736E539